MTRCANSVECHMRSIARRTEHVRTGELHGAVAHARHRAVAQFVSAGAADLGHLRFIVSMSVHLLKDQLTPAISARLD